MKIKLHGISITEDILSKLQCGLRERSKIYELFKNHTWSLTSSRCGGGMPEAKHPTIIFWGRYVPGSSRLGYFSWCYVSNEASSGGLQFNTELQVQFINKVCSFS